jgi:hypothetical protein
MVKRIMGPRDLGCKSDGISISASCEAESFSVGERDGIHTACREMAFGTREV